MGECAKIKRKEKEWIDTAEKKGQKLIEEIKIELKFNVRSFFVFLISLMPCRFLSIRTSKREIIINSRCTRATRKKGTKEERGGVSVNSKLLQRLFRRTPCSLSFHPQLPPYLPTSLTFHPIHFNYDNANFIRAFWLFRAISFAR